MEVKIFDDQDKLIYEGTVNHRESFRKIYDLRKVQSTNYRFELSNNNDKVTLVTQ